MADIFQATVDPAVAGKHCYDVIVVGAGPAGSASAYHLAHQGADVLLVDRFSFPRDKRCGDAVMPFALEELALMNIAEEVQARYTAARFISTSFYGMPPNRAAVEPTEQFSVGYVAPRLSFDALLCTHALHAGASWLDQVTIHSLDAAPSGVANVRGVHKGKAIQLQAHIVIAADGSSSRLARQLRKSLLEREVTAPLTGPEVRMSRFTALRGYYTDIKQLDEVLEFYLHAEPGTYYHWIFPLNDGRANVGVIAPLEQLKQHHTDLARSLEAFLHSSSLQERTANASLQGQLEAAPIWSGMRGTALYGDALLCVGDAAALVHPLSAEGISSALFSGRVAAETALQALKQEDYSLDALSPYGTAVRERYEALYESLLQVEIP